MTTEPQPQDNGDEPTTRLPAQDAEATTKLPDPAPEDGEVTTQLEPERAVTEGPFGDGILGDDGGRTTRMAGTPKPPKKMSATTIVIAVLVGLLGFALVVQVRGTST